MAGGTRGPSLLTACPAARAGHPGGRPGSGGYHRTNARSSDRRVAIGSNFPSGRHGGDKDVITVTGISSPDATVSINGRLAIPNAEGHFSLELTISPDDNPLAIEVITTSVAGEELSLVRTVIFVP